MSYSQFPYIDIVIIFGIAASLDRSQPADNLAPTTPKAQLIDFKAFVLLAVHVITAFGFQVTSMFFVSIKTTISTF